MKQRFYIHSLALGSLEAINHLLQLLLEVTYRMKNQNRGDRKLLI